MLTIELATEQDNTIRAHGERAYPHECCGFLLGHELWRVEAVLPATNAKGEQERRNRFYITPRESMLAEKEARRLGLNVIGHYHSHPDAPAVPSTPTSVSESATGTTGESDLENATWPGYAFVIVSVRRGKAEEVRCWDLSPDRSKFEPVDIKIV